MSAYAGAGALLGAAQLGLVVAQQGATSETDIYLTLFACGQAVSFGGAFGVLYPRLLSPDGPEPTALIRRWQRVLPPATALSVAIGAGALLLAGRSSRSVLLIGTALGLALAMAAYVAVLAAARAARGEPRLQSAMTLLPNAMAVLALLLTLDLMDQGLRLSAVAVALAVGHAATVVALRSSTDGQGGPLVSEADRSWYMLTAASSYGANYVLQLAAATLPPGTSTLFNIALRAGGIVMTVLVGPRLSRTVTRSSVKIQHLEQLVFLVYLSLAASLTVLAVVPPALVQRQPAVELLFVWLAAAVLNAVVARLAYRSLRSEVFLVPAALVLATALGTYYAVGRVPELVVLVAGLLLLETWPMLILSRRLGALWWVVPLLCLPPISFLLGSDYALAAAWSFAVAQFVRARRTRTLVD